MDDRKRQQLQTLRQNKVFDFLDCPKCGQSLFGLDGVEPLIFCEGSIVTQHCKHGQRLEHLYSKCACGYTFAYRPAMDAKPENPLLEPEKPGTQTVRSEKGVGDVSGQ